MRVKVTERDLRHGANSVRFGNAILACEGYAPSCSDQGRCTMGGRCFDSAPHLVAARMIESLIPKDGRAGMHYAYLRRAAENLREERVHL
ncbi:hypothetical protein [Novosphingobium sp. ST904]|uniref:hypothetical protein n=1 Tax=Novosphingobium sp. ST904 TaxID=1684385 RepID=UPI0006C86514|nr:hypothetical protein [Novosphingobium sp. ST904]KPH66035.1 hypothetical protein ADT71_08705 [Novosphingobium sp. ST904]TCM33785.1 hypothetical protein EDF59_119101 [Novosphingobium sp. ST904]